MKTWKRAVMDAVIAGSFAGFTSMAAMAWRSRVENRTPWAAVNAPSHWFWGEPALGQNGRSVRYSATGLFNHYLAAGFWALGHERFLGHPAGPKPIPILLRDAAATTAVAALVDLRLVPHRLTPGFQERLSTPSLFLVYGMFGAGLALGSWLAGLRR